MNCGNEIISLHFGNFANFIGTHYFNIQEAGFSYNSQFVPDINPNRLFRSSENLITGELISYTPRAILVDDHINQNKIIVPKLCDRVEDFDESSINFEIENSAENDLLNKKLNPFLEDLKTNKSESGTSKSNFLFKSHYNLENIEHWSEFMKVNWHKNGKISTNDELSNLSSYHDGVFKAKSHTFWDQIEDSIRYFAEECHNMQGFHIVTEGNTSYSGIANTVLSHLKDEYGKKCTILVPAYHFPENFTDTNIITSLYNTVCGLGNAQEFSDLIIPISLNKNLFIDSNQHINRRFKNIYYKDFNKYEESAILATGLEFLTLPYRLRTTKGYDINMSDYCQINILNRCLTTAGIQIPFPILKKQNFTKFLNNWNNRFFESISPLCDLEIGNKYYDIFYVFTKGITQRFSYESLSKTSDKECMDILNTFFNTFYPIKHFKNFNSQDNLRIPSTFPNLFNNIYNLTNPERTEYGRISEFSGLGCLINSKSTEITLNRLYKRCTNNRTKLKIYDDSVKFEYKNTLEKLLMLASNYQDNYVV